MSSSRPLPRCSDANKLDLNDEMDYYDSMGIFTQVVPNETSIIIPDDDDEKEDCEPRQNNESTVQIDDHGEDDDNTSVVYDSDDDHIQNNSKEEEEIEEEQHAKQMSNGDDDNNDELSGYDSDVTNASGTMDIDVTKTVDTHCAPPLFTIDDHWNAINDCLNALSNIENQENANDDDAMISINKPSFIHYLERVQKNEVEERETKLEQLKREHENQLDQLKREYEQQLDQLKKEIQKKEVVVSAPLTTNKTNHLEPPTVDSSNDRHSYSHRSNHENNRNMNNHRSNRHDNDHRYRNVEERDIHDRDRDYRDDRASYRSSRGDVTRSRESRDTGPRSREQDRPTRTPISSSSSTSTALPTGMKSKVFLMTGLHKEKEKLKSDIESLGGLPVDTYDSRCTHLLVPPGKLISTSKVLIALLANLQIVTSQYITESRTANRWRSEQSFSLYISQNRTEGTVSQELSEVLDGANRYWRNHTTIEKLFHQWRVFITHSNNDQSLEHVLSTGGAILVDSFDANPTHCVFSTPKEEVQLKARAKPNCQNISAYRITRLIYDLFAPNGRHTPGRPSSHSTTSDTSNQRIAGPAKTIQPPRSDTTRRAVDHRKNEEPNVQQPQIDYSTFVLHSQQAPPPPRAAVPTTTRSILTTNKRPRVTFNDDQPNKHRRYH